jgi:hypothetical protein
MVASLFADFEAHEAENIARLRQFYFPDYVRLMSRFMPRETGPARPDFAAYTLAETATVIAAARAALRAIESGEAGLDALLTVLERDPREAAPEGGAP